MAIGNGGKKRSRVALRAANAPKVAYRSTFLTPLTAGGLGFLRDGLLVVGEDGRVESLSPYHPGSFSGVVHDLAPSLVVPGFVDVHTHFPQTRIIGSASGPLLDWLEQTVFPEESRFSDSLYAREVADEFIDDVVALGTTSAAVYSSSSARATAVLLDALLEHGLRATVGLTLMDQHSPDALRVDSDAAMTAARDLVARYHGADGDRVRFAVTPRFALSCSAGLMRSAAELSAEHGLVIQTHFAENEREGSDTLARFPHAKDYLDVYDQAGLLTGRTILAHAIHVSNSEWDRIVASGAKIAHCPDSNLFLGSGSMRLAEVLRRGIDVGLGSDVGAGRTFDMRRAMAHAYDTALSIGDPVTAEQLLCIATLGGARTLGLGEKVGSLEAGKEADFVVLARPAWADDEASALRLATFAGDLAPVLRTYVRGRLIHRS